MPASFPITTGDLVSAAALNSLVELDRVEVTSGTQASLTLTVPAGVDSAVRLVGRARSNVSAARTSLFMTFNNETGSVYRRHLINLLDTTVAGFFTNTITSIHPVDIAGANAGAGLFGMLDMTISGLSSGRPNYLFHGSVVATTSGAEARTMLGGGQVTSNIGALETIQLSPSSGQFVVGTRFVLVRA